MKNSDLMTHAETVINNCISRANAQFGKELSTPPITLDLTGRVAGMFVYNRNHNNADKIRLNRVLFVENFADFDQTIIHETAHFIAQRIYGNNIQAHGSEWKHVMRILGRTPDRCHNYDVSNAQVIKKNKFRYTCDCGLDHVIGPVRHKKMVRGAAKYRCGKCHTYISFVEALGQVTYDEARDRIPVTPKAPAKKPAPKKSTGVIGMSKKDQALAIFKSMPKATRNEVIAAFIRVLSMTPAGASTYYYNCKKAV